MAKQKEQMIDNSQPTVVDGTNLIAGRVCSNVAKLLRNGNRIFIIKTIWDQMLNNYICLIIFHKFLRTFF